MSANGQSVVVFGGNGFIGTHLTKTLKDQGYSVHAVSRSAGNIDLTDLGAVKNFLKQTNPVAVFNCAAHVGSVHYVTAHAAEVWQDNLQMTLNLYQAVADVCPQATIVNPLSNCSYPGDSTKQKEHEWLNGPVHDSVFAYGNAKRLVYYTAKCYNKQHSIKSIHFLVPNTFGPGDSTDPNKTHALNGMIIRMIQAKRNGDKTFEIWGTGTPIREWAYVQDVVTIMAKSIKMESDFLYPINIAQNHGYSIRESAEAIAEALGFEGELVFNTNYQDGAKVKVMNDDEFRKHFPDFSFYNHKQGIKETAAYYESVL